MMEEICRKKLTEIRTSLENKLSEMKLPTENLLSFVKEKEIAEGIANRCQETELLAIKQKIENLTPNSTELKILIQEIIKDIKNLLT